MSDPARMASTAASPDGYLAATPAMSNESVTISPLKLISSRKTSVVIFFRESSRHGCVRFECGHREMARHNRADAGANRRAERRQLDFVQSRTVRVYHGQIEMGIEIGVTVAREVLRSGKSAVFFDA